MKVTNTVADILNTGIVKVETPGGVLSLPLNGKFEGEPGPPGAGVPAGGEPLQMVRKTASGSTTEWVTPTKSVVGLGNVDNTADEDKPLSKAATEALAGKASTQSVASKADKADLDTKASVEDLLTVAGGKADLVEGKVPVSQLPETTPLTDSTIAPLINGATTGAAIDARINTQVAPQVQKITADYIAGDRSVADSAAAAVNANPKIAELEAAKWLRPAMPATADFNNYTTPGEVSVSTGAGKTNIPQVVSGTLLVRMAGQITVQAYTTADPIPRTYIRRLNAGAWTNWAAGSAYGTQPAGGTDFDTLKTWGTYPIYLSNHPNQPTSNIGTLEVLPSGPVLLQRFSTHEAVPRVFQRRWTGTVWQAWNQLGAADIAALTERVTALEKSPPPAAVGESPTKYGHTVRLARARQLVGVRTSPRAQVALLCDHGTVKFRDLLYPKLKALGLTCTLALNSQKMEGGSLHVDTEVDTWAQVKTWASAGIEIANHGRTHNDTDSLAVLYEEIVTGHEELETALGRPIHSWVQPSAHGDLGKWFGFKDGISWESFANTDAGRMILDRHAVVTGTIYPIGRYQLSGEPPIGMQGHWLDRDDQIQPAKDQVLAAQNEKTGVLLRMHPGYLGGQNTVEAIHGFLEWLAAEKAAGRIDVVTLSQWALTRIS